MGVQMNPNYKKTQEAKKTASLTEERQRQGLSPLTEAEIADAEKNTEAQKFRNIGFTGFGGENNKDLESRYQKLTATPQYSESTNAFRSQMALRKSRQTSTRLGG